MKKYVNGEFGPSYKHSNGVWYVMAPNDKIPSIRGHNRGAGGPRRIVAHKLSGGGDNWVNYWEPAPSSMSDGWEVSRASSSGVDDMSEL